MAVLIEAISVIIRADALLGCYPGGWSKFEKEAPNKTLCADGILVRLGFLSPRATQEYVESLVAIGLRFDPGSEDQSDIVVVDEREGALSLVDWLQFGHVEIDGVRHAAVRAIGDLRQTIAYPEGWDPHHPPLTFYPGGLENMTILNQDGNLLTAHDSLTGKIIYTTE